MVKLVIIGNLGAAAESKLVNGIDLTVFRVATNSKWTDKNGIVCTESQWYSCIGRNLGNVRQYLSQGKKVYVEGKPAFKVYKSNDGTYKCGVDINVTNLELLSNNEAKHSETPRSDVMEIREGEEAF